MELQRDQQGTECLVPEPTLLKWAQRVLSSSPFRKWHAKLRFAVAWASSLLRGNGGGGGGQQPKLLGKPLTRELPLITSENPKGLGEGKRLCCV